jgi:hypothetical protein
MAHIPDEKARLFVKSGTFNRAASRHLAAPSGWRGRAPAERRAIRGSEGAVPFSRARGRRRLTHSPAPGGPPPDCGGGRALFLVAADQPPTKDRAVFRRRVRAFCRTAGIDGVFEVARPDAAQVGRALPSSISAGRVAVPELLLPKPALRRNEWAASVILLPAAEARVRAPKKGPHREMESALHAPGWSDSRHHHRRRTARGSGQSWGIAGLRWGTSGGRWIVDNEGKMRRLGRGTLQLGAK